MGAREQGFIHEAGKSESSEVRPDEAVAAGRRVSVGRSTRVAFRPFPKSPGTVLPIFTGAAENLAASLKTKLCVAVRRSGVASP